MIRLLAAFKAAWIADLREHPELQGKNRLTTIEPDGTEYDCCLGRACKILDIPRYSVIPVSMDDPDDKRTKVEYKAPNSSEPFASITDDEVTRLVTGDKEPDGKLDEIPGLWIDSTVFKQRDIYYSATIRNHDDAAATLSGFNDTGFTFPQIADIIDYFFEAKETPTT